jgi:hypothetical protein
MVELLKALELTFGRHALSIVSTVNHICQNISFVAINMIEKARVRLSDVADGSGVDVMVTIFCDFGQFSAKKIGVFLKN